MTQTVTDNGKVYQVYDEKHLADAKVAKSNGKRVYIVRHCGQCGAELYGSNLVIMRKSPVCATH